MFGMLIVAVLAIISAIAILVVVVQDQRKRDEKSFQEGFKRVIDEIRGDSVMLSIVRLMIKKNGLDSDDIVKEAGSELKAKMIIDRLLCLYVVSGFFSLFIFRQSGSKIFIDQRWLDPLRRNLE